MPHRTDTTFDRLRAWLPWAALLTAFSAGGATTHTSARISELEKGKQNRTEAVIRDSAIMVELRAIRADGTATRALAERTGKRVSAMYCSGKPAGCE